MHSTKRGWKQISIRPAGEPSIFNLTATRIATTAIVFDNGDKQLYFNVRNRQGGNRQSIHKSSKPSLFILQRSCAANRSGCRPARPSPRPQIVGTDQAIKLSFLPSTAKRHGAWNQCKERQIRTKHAGGFGTLLLPPGVLPRLGWNVSVLRRSLQKAQITTRNASSSVLQASPQYMQGTCGLDLGVESTWVPNSNHMSFPRGLVSSC